MDFYLAGQTNFGNRGCEALVRSSVSMIKDILPESRFICPLENISRDSKNWPDSEEFNVEYVNSLKFSKYMKWWSRVNKIIPLTVFGIPSIRLDRETQSYIENASAIIMTGGDNITLDYGVMALYQWCGFMEKTMNAGLPTILWAGSVGPFSHLPGVEKNMIKHLQKYKAITVRESVSFNYLKSLGIKNVKLVADPAFCLKPESCEFKHKIKDSNKKYLGLNISPLINRFSKSNKLSVESEMLDFIKKILNKTDYNILLISHVDYGDTVRHNSDWHYMKSLCDQLTDYHDRLILTPQELNAAQVKDIIGCCEIFIGARTHSTIAALSQCVPTISLAYSVKAIGINIDLFGHQNYVIDKENICSTIIEDYFDRIEEEKEAIRNRLIEKIPEWRKRAIMSAEILKQCIQ
jgi:polysaccharide pyruvyl transferase WcaK-like protein